MSADVKTEEEKGHPGLWWPSTDTPDENPEVRAKYAADFDAIPKQRPHVPSRRQILKRGHRG